MVFTRLKHGADKVVKFQQLYFPWRPLMNSENAADGAVDVFAAGRCSCSCVATADRRKRIDVPGIFRMSSTTSCRTSRKRCAPYRRTARACAGGTALSFRDSSERLIQGIEKLTRAASRWWTIATPRPRVEATPRTPRKPLQQERPQDGGRASAAAPAAKQRGDQRACAVCAACRRGGPARPKPHVFFNRKRR